MILEDIYPLFSYLKIKNIEKLSNVGPLIYNLRKNIPDFIDGHAPRLVKINDKILIKGTSTDLIYASAFINKNPNVSYYVDVYEDYSVAEEKFKSFMGINYEDYLNFIPDTESNDIKKISNESYLDEVNESIRSKSDIYLSIKGKIENYNRKSPGCHLLIGHTGISKSSIIEAVVDDLNNSDSEWGYRLTVIKSGFIDKVDFQGYVDDFEVDGNTVWSDSPMFDLLNATTPFVEECRRFLKENEKTSENSKLIEKMEFYAKTPILFFDEINRSTGTIQNILMTIINQHKLGNYDLSIAPVVAAANLPVEMEELDEDSKEKIKYIVSEITDPAIANRMIPLLVSYKDSSVIDATYSYLRKKFKDSKNSLAILDYAYENKILYDLSAVDKYGKFPTFRGYEDLCKYISYCEKNNKKVLMNMVSGLLGANITPKILSQIDLEISSSNSTDNFINSSLDSGIPTLLLGRMGIGKTAKINKYCKDNNAIPFFVDLPSMDRTTISGYPVKESFIKKVFNEDNSIDDAIFHEVFMKFANNPDIPKQTTTFIPNYKILEEIKACKEIKDKDGKIIREKKKIVLVFDEFNRCLHGDTKIPLLDGRTLSMKEIYEEFGTNKEFYVYSRNQKGKIIPVKARSLGVTIKNAELIRVHLDNNTYVDSTPDHKFMLKDGTYKEAQYLKPNESLSPCFFSFKDINSFGGYKSVLQNDGNYELVHRLVVKEMLGGYKGKEKKVIRNSIKSRRTDKYRKYSSEKFNNAWKNGSFEHVDFSLTKKKTVVTKTINIARKIAEEKIELTKENYIKFKNNYKKCVGRSDNIALSLDKIDEYFGSFENLKNFATCNHKVVKIEYLNNKADVYDIEVPDYHNFALENGIFVHNSSAILQSSIFNAISDKKFLGVDLSDIDFSVVAAGNWDEEEGVYSSQVVDAATLHRFSSNIITEVNEEDLDSFLNYCKENFTNVYRILKKLDKRELLEELNRPLSEIEDDVENEIQLAKPILSFRTFENLDELLAREQYNILDITNNMNEYLKGNQDLVDILSSDEYILKIDNEAIIQFSDDYKNIIELYNNKSMSVHDYIIKTVELLQNKEISDIDKTTILTILQEEQDNMLGSLFIQLEGIVNEKDLHFFKKLVVEFQIEKTKERLKISSISLEDIITANSEEDISDSDISKSIDKFLSSIDSPSMSEEFSSMIMRVIETAEDKVNGDNILRLLNNFNNNELTVLSRIDYNEFLDNIEIFSSKISEVKTKIYNKVNFGNEIQNYIKDKSLNYYVNYLEKIDIISSGNSSIISSLSEEELDGSYETIDEYYYFFSFGIVNFSDDTVSPNYYTIQFFVNSQNSNTRDYISSKFIFNTDKWKLKEFKKVNTNKNNIISYNLVYKNESKFLITEYEVNTVLSVNPTVLDINGNTLFTLVPDVPTEILHENLERFQGVLKTLKMYGEDISSIDSSIVSTEDMNKIRDLIIKTKPNSFAQNIVLMLDLSGSMMINAKFWKIVEKNFYS